LVQVHSLAIRSATTPRGKVPVTSSRDVQDGGARRQNENGVVFKKSISLK
jgi:hypothetical protein